MSTKSKGAAKAVATKSATPGLQRMTDVAPGPLETPTSMDDYKNMELVSIDTAIVPLMALVPNVKESVKQAKSAYSQTSPPEGLTIDESASIRLYTMQTVDREQSFYVKLNKVLRSKDRQELPAWRLYLKLLLTALARFQSTQQTVYRGVQLDLHLEYPTNKVFTWWAFTSTSLKVNVLKDFLNPEVPRTMFIINCRSGKNIRSFSSFEDEEEVLILPETQFKVVATLDQGHGLHTIQLEEVRSPHYMILAPGKQKRSQD